MQCLINTELQPQEARAELMALTSELMPGGRPAFTSVVQYPSIAQLITEHGRKTMMKVVYLLIKDFCHTLNVVRNMNDIQMLEAANMMIDECHNFRLEDYTMLFAMAKRGQLIKIYDRIDISIISSMMDAYFALRSEAAQQLYEQEEHKRERAWHQQPPPPTTPDEQAASERFGRVLLHLEAMQEEIRAQKEREDQDYRRRRKESLEALKKLNMEEVLRQFPPKKKEGDEYIPYQEC